MRKFLTSFLFLVVAAGALLFLAKDLIAKVVFESAVGALTGFDAKVGSIRLDPVNGIVQLEGLVLFNPYEFEQRIFADAPELYLQIDIPALLKKERTHINEIRIAIRELNIEKNERGVSNISLLTSLGKSSKTQQMAPSQPAVQKPKMPFQLDRLVLTMRKVSYNDRSGIVPKKLSMDMRVEGQVFEGITDAKSIVNIILMKVVTATPFGNLGINQIELQNQLKSSVLTARQFGEKVFLETGTQIVGRTGIVGKKLVGEGKETFGQVGETAKEELTSLFGKFRAKLENSSSSEPQQR